MTGTARAILSLLLLSGIWAVPGRLSAGTIRVALIEGAATLEVNGSPLRVSDQAGRVAVTLHGSPIKIVPLRSDLDVGGKRFHVPVVRLEPAGSSALKLGGREYRGMFEV